VVKWIYACPACAAMLNPGESVVLVAAQDDRRMLMAFSPEPGNYALWVPPHTTITPGTKWDFQCPVCQQSLTADEHENLCVLDLIEGNARRRVFFSRVAGEHATVVLADKQVMGYGEHAPTYMKLFLEMKHLG
jgi:hypothetical protein